MPRQMVLGWANSPSEKKYLLAKRRSIMFPLVEG